MAARGAKEWRTAIANVADLAIQFTSTIYKPTSFSSLKKKWPRAPEAVSVRTSFGCAIAWFYLSSTEHARLEQELHHSLFTSLIVSLVEGHPQP